MRDAEQDVELNWMASINQTAKISTTLYVYVLKRCVRWQAPILRSNKHRWT